MIVNIERQGQAIGLKGVRQEVEVIQQGFGAIEAGTDIIARGIIQEIEQTCLSRELAVELVKAGAAKT